MTFVKAIREGYTAELLFKKRHSAFMLLYIIAKRAKRSTEHPDEKLEIGEAFIGDYANYGVTESTYRTDKSLLKSTGQVTFRTTNKGTIAKIVDTSIFDINVENSTDKLTDNLTGNQRTEVKKSTTNKNVINNDKNNNGDFLNLSPLTNEEVTRIAMEMRVDRPDVFRVQREVLDPENIKKYNTRSTFKTVRKWISRQISKGQIKQLGDLELEALKTLYGGNQA